MWDQGVKPPKLMRRISIGIKWLKPYGIWFRDTAIIAMTGEVRVGELGYFDINHQYSHHYNQFAFLCAQDEKCLEWTNPEAGGVCLRDYVDKCRARHEGTPYGRVIAVERKRQPVETSLTFRPLDEREQATTAILRNQKTEDDEEVCVC